MAIRTLRFLSPTTEVHGYSVTREETTRVFDDRDSSMCHETNDLWCGGVELKGEGRYNPDNVPLPSREGCLSLYLSCLSLVQTDLHARSAAAGEAEMMPGNGVGVEVLHGLEALQQTNGHVRGVGEGELFCSGSRQLPLSRFRKTKILTRLRTRMLRRRGEGGDESKEGKEEKETYDLDRCVALR